MNRKERKSFLKYLHVNASVAIAIPPKDLPMQMENKKIGRNDPCPCGAKNMAFPANAEEFLLREEDGIQYFDEQEPTEIPVKYKDCCMKSGIYENYKTNN